MKITIVIPAHNSDDSKNLSAIKNAGVAQAKSEWVVTIDADSWMSKGALAEMYRHAKSPTSHSAFTNTQQDKQMDITHIPFNQLIGL